MLFPLILTFGVIYVVLILPQKKRDQERKGMLEKLRKHDRVLTAGGIWGTVFSVKDNEVVLRVDEDNNVRIRFSKDAIVRIETAAGEGQRGEGAEAGAAREKK
ncbi:MAG: preprotein translocase subunit YajC [Planctomycetes bacterium]|nr:preprotein translocase subunit YajC [Planctomycetota bacterium]